MVSRITPVLAVVDVAPIAPKPRMLLESQAPLPMNDTSDMQPASPVYEEVWEGDEDLSETSTLESDSPAHVGLPSWDFRKRPVPRFVDEPSLTSQIAAKLPVPSSFYANVFPYIWGLSSQKSTEDGLKMPLVHIANNLESPSAPQKCLVPPELDFSVSSPRSSPVGTSGTGRFLLQQPLQNKPRSLIAEALGTANRRPVSAFFRRAVLRGLALKEIREERKGVEERFREEMAEIDRITAAIERQSHSPPSEGFLDRPFVGYYDHDMPQSPSEYIWDRSSASF